MDAPLISVIVPIYNVEPYLDRCVRSILGQTYPHLEVLLVDDGSPDRCASLCDAWAAKDGRVKVIHKENGGLSDARNAGLAAATGVYTGFVDGDDYISPDMYRLLLERLERDGSDIAVCGVELVHEDGSPIRVMAPAGSHVLDHHRAMEAIVREDLLTQTVWNKLYKTDLIRAIPFPVGKYHEDVFWSWRAVARAERVSVFDAPCYFYVQRGGSIMGTDYSPKRLDAIEAKVQRQAFLEAHCPALARLGRTDLLFTCLYQGQQAIRYLEKEERAAVLAHLRQTAQRFPVTPCDRRTLPLARRIWPIVARVDFEFACKLRNALKKGL